MSKKNFHSVPWGDDWAVKKEGISKPISVHRTQATTEDKTRILAKKAEVEAVYHNRQGIIKDKDSFGNDPHPPIDKKY
jgi:hypothetical protein